MSRRGGVSQEKPMTFRGDVRPHYSDPLCSPREFPRERTGNDTAPHQYTPRRALWQPRRRLHYKLAEETIASYGLAPCCKGTVQTHKPYRECTAHRDGVNGGQQDARARGHRVPTSACTHKVDNTTRRDFKLEKPVVGRENS